MLSCTVAFLYSFLFFNLSNWINKTRFNYNLGILLFNPLRVDAKQVHLPFVDFYIFPTFILYIIYKNIYIVYISPKTIEICDKFLIMKSYHATELSRNHRTESSQNKVERFSSRSTRSVVPSHERSILQYTLHVYGYSFGITGSRTIELYSQKPWRGARKRGPRRSRRGPRASSRRFSRWPGRVPSLSARLSHNWFF